MVGEIKKAIVDAVKNAKKAVPSEEKGPVVSTEEELILRRLVTLADIDLKKNPPTSEDVMMDLSILARGELLILIKIDELLNLNRIGET